jgi:cobalt-zinc-cadmium efflux system membrane fusion protein
MDSEQRTAHQRERSLLRAIASALPTICVLGILTAVGLWGHHNGWKAPEFSALFGRSASTEREDWCSEHGVPESKCIACHPELVGESGVGWCREHGLPESKCTVCHPEISKTGVAGDWCAEHGLPESGCTICHPEIARKGELPPDETAAVVTAGSHEGELPGDHPAGDHDSSPRPLRDPRTCQKHALKVQFASRASVEKAGVQLGQAALRTMSDSVVVNAEVDYDRTRFAKISSRVAGSTLRVEKELGAAVRAGDVLALIDSAEIGRAKAEYLQASAAVEVTGHTAQRVQRSSEAGFRTESERLAAEAAAREAEIRLFNARQALVNLGFDMPVDSVPRSALVTLGIPEAIRDSRASNSGSANLIPIVAPFDGVLVSRNLVVGEMVEPARTLFEIADTRRMWVRMDLPQAEAHRIALGQEAIFRPDDARDEVVTGEVTWISTAVDEMTRTVTVRADVENGGGALRAHSFGRAQIVVRTKPDAVAVPSQAIQWEGCCYVVFVRLSDEIFQTRKVRLGAKDSAYTEIVAGLVPGEVVATAGSHVLKSEILKSSLGAGCTDD